MILIDLETDLAREQEDAGRVRAGNLATTTFGQITGAMLLATFGSYRRLLN